MTLHSAKGLGVRSSSWPGSRRRTVPALAVAEDEDKAQEERRPVLRGDDARAGAPACLTRRGPATGVRRIPKSSEPSRFIGRVPPSSSSAWPPCVLVVRGYQGASALRLQDEPHATRRRRASRERATPTYAYEDEIVRGHGAASSGMGVAARRSSASGPCISIEALNDDTKLVVRFNTVGRRTLRARIRERLSRRDSDENWVGTLPSSSRCWSGTSVYRYGGFNPTRAGEAAARRSGSTLRSRPTRRDRRGVVRLAPARRYLTDEHPAIEGRRGGTRARRRATT